MEKPKFKILQEVTYEVTSVIDEVETTVTRMGIIKSIEADLWLGDHYASGYNYKYRIVDNMYSPKVDRWLEETCLQGLNKVTIEEDIK